MSSKVFSASVFGFECKTVEVEVDILNGPASITIVGLGDASVQESKERIRCAIKNSGAEYPRRKKTINLAPADLHKHGPMFDLPIAVGLLVQSGQIHEGSLADTAVMGELALNGNLRRINGVLAMVSHLKAVGFKKFILPTYNSAEASLIKGAEIFGANNLKSVIDHLRGFQRIEPFERTEENRPLPDSCLWHFEDIKGHDRIKRALTIAASGMHNIFLIGPPGSGKTLLARGFQSILPQMSFEEAIDVTKIYSISGKLPHGQALISTPPFRAVHHTASTISLVGGGSIPRPGEISLAHNGVLFLDELLEFPRSTLDSIRQPIEDGFVNVTRAKASVTFPSRFILMAATNPCACGYFGDPIRACRCTPSQLSMYQKKLSGPLLDRIDIMCTVPRLPFEKISVLEAAESSEQIKKRVCAARIRQFERFGKNIYNGRISSQDTQKYCAVSEAGMALLKSAFSKFHYSGRSYYRIIKIARTIADMEDSANILENHMAEALAYRPQFGQENV